MPDTSPETEEKIGQLSMIDQTLQNLLVQKQTFQVQLMEIESALEELKTTKSAYKIVGNIMVASEKQDLEKDLNQKKEMVELRIKTLEKQEKSVKEKASKMRSEVLEQIKDNNKKR